ncbi:fruit-specific protein-like [Capsicum chacoense]
MVSLKQAFIFIALFVAISVNISWDPKVMALRDLPIDVAEMKEKLLLPFGNDRNLMTCYRSCTSDDDCSDGIICKTCARIGHTGRFYDCSAYKRSF